MFHLYKQIKGILLFQHKQLKDVNSISFVRKRIKKTYEGRCLQDMGYLIQIKDYGQKDFAKTELKVEERGILAEVTFNVFCFKEKGHIIDFTVDSVSKDVIQGSLGPVKVIIPMFKLQNNDFHFNDLRNTYEYQLSDGLISSVEVGEFMRGRVYECSIYGESSMQILCETNLMLLQSQLMHY